VTVIEQFRSAVRDGWDKVNRLEQICAGYELTDHSFRADSCRSVLDGSRLACHAADKIIQSWKLESLGSDNATTEALKMFEAFLKTADFHIRNNARIDK
jgi:hypothetical protein